MPKKNDKTPDSANVMAELYELSIPGQIIGKEVIDASARKIGVVRNVKLTFPPTKVNLTLVTLWHGSRHRLLVLATCQTKASMPGPRQCAPCLPRYRGFDNRIRNAPNTASRE